MRGRIACPSDHFDQNLPIHRPSAIRRVAMRMQTARSTVKPARNGLWVTADSSQIIGHCRVTRCQSRRTCPCSYSLEASCRYIDLSRNWVSKEGTNCHLTHANQSARGIMYRKRSRQIWGERTNMPLRPIARPSICLGTKRDVPAGKTLMKAPDAILPMEVRRLMRPVNCTTHPYSMATIKRDGKECANLVESVS